MQLQAIFGRDAQLAALRRSAFVRGARAAAPALVATSIWGLVTGVAMIKTGLSTGQALAMTLLVYAGSAQMAALPLIAVSAPVWVVVLTAVIVNLRFVIFSATLWSYLGCLPLLRRLVLGYLTADIGLALFMNRYADAPVEQRGSTEQVWYLFGSCSATWLSWQPMSIVGIFLAGYFPAQWGLEFAAILALIAFTVPLVVGRPTLAGCLTAGLVAVLAAALPLKLGLLLAVIAGVAVAMTVDLLGTRTARRQST
jgi:predicted branched-subunit amino acid permease